MSNTESFLMKSPNFKEFLAVLKALSEVCNDLHFVDGKVLQRSNDKTTVIGFDLSEMFKIPGTCIFSDIKKVLKNLNVLNKSHPIIFKCDGEKIQISDRKRYINFILGPEKFCDNKRMSEEELKTIFGDKSKILEATFPMDLCISVSKLCWLNNSNAVEIRIADDRATFAVFTNNRGGVHPTFKTDYKLHHKIHGISVLLPLMPLDFKRPLTLTVELDKVEPKAFWQAKASITENISFDLYGRASV